MKRYSLKKWLCGFSMFLAMLQIPAALPVAAAEEGGAVRVPVIMYHSLLNKSTNEWNISPEAFEKDLKYLSENGYRAVFISELIAYVYEGGALPEKPVVLTFDDGYYNNYTQAMPLLKKYDMKMVLSVIGANTDMWTKHPDETDERYGHVTWPQISEMVQSGRVELANHTQSMHKNSNGRIGCSKKRSEDIEQYEKTLTDDVEALQNKLEEVSGTRPECFTYPFGKKCRESVDILKKLGFKATLSCASGINILSVGDPDCLIYMKRNNRTPKQSAESILKKLEGGLAGAKQ